MPALMTAMNTYGMPWREHVGIIITLIVKKMMKNPNVVKEMMNNLSDANEILSKRKINQVSDLNLGDLATFLETSLPFFILADINYEDYPALSNLYKIMQEIPEFEEIDQEFKQFTEQIIDLKNSPHISPTFFTYLAEIWTSVKLFCYVKWNGIDMTKNL